MNLSMMRRLGYRKSQELKVDTHPITK